MERWLASNRRVVGWVVVTLVAVGAFVFIFFVLPPLVVDDGKNRVADENGVRSAGSQFLAALVLATGLYFTGRTLQVNREGQLTDRFTKAIEQLGDDKVDIRLGGIYALERIARDSRRDHPAVMEILSAYVRRYVRTDRDPADRPPLDVQAIVSVLGRRETRYDEPNKRPLDLTGADLRFVEMNDADFSRSWLEGVDLTEARLVRTRLRGIGAPDAKLGAWFLAVDFAGAKLDTADLTDASYDRRTTWPADFDPEAHGATALE